MTHEEKDGADSRVLTTDVFDIAGPTGIPGFRFIGREGGWALDFLTLKIDVHEVNGTYQVATGQIAAFTHKISAIENIRIEILADQFRRGNSSNYHCAGHSVRA